MELGPFNTGSSPAGFYQVKVETSPDPYLGRIYTATFSFWATITEDINRDFKVNMRDIGLSASAFGSSPGSRNWNIVADVNRDWKVNMRDIAKIARKFGWTA